MRLWTPQGAGRARRFYEREGWTATGNVHEDSPFGLPTVEYARRVVAGDDELGIVDPLGCDPEEGRPPIKRILAWGRRPA